MSEHQKEPGKRFLKLLKQLGIALGYYSVNEFKITEGSTSAVDVAWFKDKKQKFPLFIFEIESTSTNGMTYNPIKIFAKDNTTFEKPLFMFQIVLTKGQDSEKFEDLKREFGKFNYRIYRLSLEEEINFYKDILSQNRRVSEFINLNNIFRVFIKHNVDSQIVNQLFLFIEELEYNNNSNKYLLFYTSIYEHTLYKNNLLRYILNKNSYGYEGYYSSWYGYIFLGALEYYNTENLEKKEDIINSIINWQNNNGQLKMIWPNFGLSMDYDKFIIYSSARLLAIVYGTCNSIKMYNFIKDILLEIIKSLKENYRISTLIWLFHLSNSNKDDETKVFAFTELKKIYENVDSILLNSPFIYEDNNWEDDIIDFECTLFQDSILDREKILEYYNKNSILSPDILITRILIDDEELFYNSDSIIFNVYNNKNAA